MCYDILRQEIKAKGKIVRGHGILSVENFPESFCSLAGQIYAYNILSYIYA